MAGVSEANEICQLPYLFESFYVTKNLCAVKSHYVVSSKKKSSNDGNVYAVRR